MLSIHFKERITLTPSATPEQRMLNQYWEQLHRDRFGDDVDGIYPPELERGLYQRLASQMALPSGLLQHLRDFLSRHAVAHQVIDDRSRAQARFACAPVLRGYQEAPCRALMQLGGGVLVGPPGCGKTVMAMHVISAVQGKALWVTHSPQLAWQAAEKARHFLGIAAFDQVNEAAGFYQADALTIGVPGSKAWTGACDAVQAAGVLVVDEAHKLDTALPLAHLVNQCPAAFKIGLTAYEPPPIVRHLLGPVTARLTLQQMQQAHGVVLPRYVPIPSTHAGTAFDVDAAIRALVRDDARNAQIFELVLGLAGAGHRVMVLSGKSAHCAALGSLLQARLGDRVGVIAGKGADRMVTLKRVESGHHTILVGDARMFEGMDLPVFDRLVLALPTADPRWILQQAGRIMRPADHKRDAVICDIIDSSPVCLARLADRRVRHLREALDWTSER